VAMVIAQASCPLMLKERLFLSPDLNKTAIVHWPHKPEPDPQ